MKGNDLLIGLISGFVNWWLFCLYGQEIQVFNMISKSEVSLIMVNRKKIEHYRQNYRQIKHIRLSIIISGAFIDIK